MLLHQLLDIMQITLSQRSDNGEHIKRRLTLTGYRYVRQYLLDNVSINLI